MSCAYVVKSALPRIQSYIHSDKVQPGWKLLNMSHDEITFEAPGNAILDPKAKSPVEHNEEGYVSKVHWTTDNEYTLAEADHIKKIMEEELEVLLEGVVPSVADVGIGPYWVK